MPHLRIKKRTLQLDDDRAILIGGTPSNPIWTTVGEKRMSPEEKQELSANLAAQRKQAAVHKVVQRVHAHFEQFLIYSLACMAPKDVSEAYAGGNDGPWDLWLREQPFGFHTEGLTATITHKGKEIATTTAKVDPLLKADVEQMLKMEKAMAKANL